MCGIAGIFSLNDSAQEPQDWLIDRMTDSLAHRGPNDRGTWCGQRVALGSRRLSVIDLSNAGHMPMGNENGSIQITYNGEVYNFRELKKEYKLEEHGHVFRSRTDTEVLIHLYEELGFSMFDRLNGMFAFAIWNEREQKLILARDRYGIKPLFYQCDGRRFRFGSEIKAILVDPSVPRRPSIQALHDFLSYDYIPGRQTAFEGIFELPPAHWMSVDIHGKIEIHRYWDMSTTADDEINERDAVQQIRELMERAVERQLVADVPVGVMLSGGMDSSVLVAFMSRHTSQPVHTYSVGFEENSFNELPYARIAANTFHSIQREIVITPQRVRALLPEYLKYIDEPYADGSAIPTYYVCQLAKDEVVVVLSGEGGDEIFAGYETYSAYKVSRLFRRLPRFFRNGLVAPLINRLPATDKKLSLEFKMKRFLGGLDLDPPRAHLWWRIVLTEAQKMRLYSSRVLEEIVLEHSDRHFLDAYSRLDIKDELSRLLYVDGSVFLPDDLMIKNDRMSMAHSLEARVPMTDNELVGFLAKVPSRLKLPYLQKKHLMRRAMEGILPASILNKKKVGLEIPYSKWFKNELKEFLKRYLEPGRIADSGLFRPEAVQSIVDEHMVGKFDHGRVLWGLLNYMMWLELYIP